MTADFNHLQKWLLPKIDASGMSVEQFARKVKLSRGQIYKYFDDSSRPSSQAMARICRALGVPLEEGLRQYTPRPPGRPRGTSGTTREVRVRQR